MNPGRRVASPRSTTRAPAGTCRLEPTALIFPPSTITTASRIVESPLPENSRAALSATTSVFVSSASPRAGSASTARARMLSFIVGLPKEAASYRKDIKDIKDVKDNQDPGPWVLFVL